MITSTNIEAHIDAVSDHARDWHDLPQMATYAQEGVRVVELAREIDLVLLGHSQAHALTAIAMVLSGLLVDGAGDVAFDLGASSTEFLEQIYLYVAALSAMRKAEA